jgi:hypothetical protein
LHRCGRNHLEPTAADGNLRRGWTVVSNSPRLLAKPV